MNELHLKYQQDTGIQVSRQVESLCGTQSLQNQFNCPECEKLIYPEKEDCSEVYNYIKWLEERCTFGPIKSKITIPGYLKGLKNE